MTNEHRQTHVAAELKRGDTSLHAAETLLAVGDFADAVSRAYYAVHHYVRAALLTLGIEARSHEGLRSLFGQHFIQTGLLKPAMSRTLSHLQQDREDADYERFFVLDREGAEERIAVARQFIEEMRRYLAAGGWLPSQ
jgi:uncharacterized protein (UPF0332 family)